MTDENTGPDAEGVDWGDMTQSVADELATYAPTPAPVGYPEYPALPEAPISINFRPGDKPQITVRGHCAAQITAALNDLEANGVYANLAAAMASLNAQGPLGAGLGPVSPAAPPQAAPAPPQNPFQSPGPAPFGPNMTAPTAPGYQGPPPQQQWQQAPPANGGWGGGGGARGNGPEPQPAGWGRVTVPFNDKDRFKGLRAQGTETGNYLRGKIKWGDKGGVYWVEPSVMGWLAQQGFPVTQ